jgi:hypothetical protein
LDRGILVEIQVVGADIFCFLFVCFLFLALFCVVFFEHPNIPFLDNLTGLWLGKTIHVPDE